MKKYLFLFITVLLSISSQGIFAQCHVIYVSPVGTGTGTKLTPSSLSNAIAIAQPKDVIKMATGTYNIDAALMIADSITYEGGFLIGSNWDKTSTPGATVINRTTLSPEGPTGSQRIVAFYGNTKKGFRFQDITITTSAANLPGMSTYGVHLTACSDYNFIRVRITPGAAAAGANGVAGTAGAVGGVGSQGGSSNCDNVVIGPSGGNGGVGAGNIVYGAGGAATDGVQNNGSTLSAASGRTGGGGGGGGSGGDRNYTNNAGNGGSGMGSACLTGGSLGSRGAEGDPGGDGINGGDGNAGTGGITGTIGLAGTHVGAFWQPGSNGNNGTDGCGGSGGGGGGGGGRQRGAFIIESAGNGGSGGGGGGQGGTAGTGGSGGGSSFGAYIYNNGAGGNFVQCLLQSGAAGAGGSGGIGGAGGTGGNGGARRISCTSEIGEGGAGGNGGTGGSGGVGGSGANGISMLLYATGTGLSTNVTTFDLAAQPIITSTEVFATNQNVTLASATSSTWGLGIGATPSSATGLTATAQYSSKGRKDITVGANVYVGFVNIPFASPTTPTLQAPSTTICSGSSVLLSIASGNLNDATSWQWYQGTCGSTSIGTGTSVSVTPTLNTTTYYARAEGGCPAMSTCGSITIIKDNISPVANVTTLSAITAQCSVTSLTAPTATDNCSGVVTGTHNATLPITAVGTTAVTWTYTDAQNNTSTQVQSVIIGDDTDPVPNTINLLDIEVVGCSLSSLTAPSATDNCAGAIVGTHNATLPITTPGSTPVTWSYVDGQGNTSTQVQNIIITCPTGVFDQESTNGLFLFPNPSEGVFTLVVKEDAVVTIVTEFGQAVQSINVKAGSNEIKLDAGLVQGIYFMIGTMSSQSINEKIIILKN